MIILNGKGDKHLRKIANVRANVKSRIDDL